MSVLVFCRNGALAAWLAAAVGFFIPFSTAAANISLLLLLFAWLVMPERRERLRLFWANPLARIALLLFLALALACLWGEAPLHERIETLKKYGDLLLIGFMAGILCTVEQRQRAAQGFFFGMALLLILSTAIWIGILPEGVFGKVGAGAVVMKLSITHNWLMACFAFCCALCAAQARSGWRYGLVLLACLATLNILFMVGGRTGYVILAMLAVYGFYVWKDRRGLALALVAILVAGAVGMTLSPRFSARLGEVVSDVRQWKPGEGARTSQGLRLDWYRVSLELIAERPLTGYGTGGFEPAAKQRLAGSNIVAVANPHNEYLLLAVQLGLLGPLLLGALFVVAWKVAIRLPVRDRYLLRALVVAMAGGCLFNSFLYDFTEGLFFAWAAGVLCSGVPANVDKKTRLLRAACKSTPKEEGGGDKLEHPALPTEQSHPYSQLHYALPETVAQEVFCTAENKFIMGQYNN